MEPPHHHPALVLLILGLAVVGGVTASYRKFGFLNHDICPEDKKTKTLNLGAGAAIFTLDTFDTDMTDKYSTCQLKIKADDGYGLMLYVEDMYLRREIISGGPPRCLDYIQFGIDDLVPFVTIIKSLKLCGNETGFTYDDPDGNLLIWLGMGPTYPSASRESVKLSRLLVIVTAYRKQEHRTDLANYRSCGDGRRWIRKEYFCDKRANCALDPEPADERPNVCRHLLHGEGGGGGQPGDPDQPPPWQPPLNLVSITLILVSVFVILVLALLLVARMRRARWCCFSIVRAMESCELPERSAGHHHHLHARMPAASHRLGSGALQAGRGGGTGERVENVYSPLAMHIEESSGHHRRHTTGLLAAIEGDRGTTPDTEPPPAYHDLFPVGYKFPADKIEDETASHVGLVLSNQKESAGEEVGVLSSAANPAAGSAAVVELMVEAGLPAAAGVVEAVSAAREEAGSEVPRSVPRAAP